MTRILLISGSTRDDSPHTAALRTVARFAPAGIGATLYGGLRAIPAYVPGERPLPDVVAAVRYEVAQAGAVLFCTPEYGGTLPGSLKNLLDWLVDDNALNNKPVAWLSVTGPAQDAGALAALETVLGQGHANARLLSSACIRIPLGPGLVGPDGTVIDQRLHLGLADMLHALVKSLTVAPKPQLPSWQAYSSVYPVIEKRDTPTYYDWRARRG
jgi:chromate reductase